MTFSIIIPCYNVAAFLHECLDSVLMQSFSDWEAICVDDGSTDESGLILDGYAKQDVRIKVVHQENKKQAAARNAAIEIAQGEYIVMLDSDDVLQIGFLAHLSQTITATQPDVVAINVEHWYFERNVKKIDIQYSHPMSRTFATGKEYLIYFEHLKHWGPSGMFYVYRRDIVRMYKLRFMEGIYHEDDLFAPQLCFFAQKVVIDTDLVYCYRMREGSTMHTQTQKNVEDKLFVAHSLDTFWRDNNWDNATSRSITYNAVVLGIIGLKRLKMKVSRETLKLAWRCANWKRKVKLVVRLLK